MKIFLSTPGKFLKTSLKFGAERILNRTMYLSKIQCLGRPSVNSIEKIFALK